MSPVAGFDGLDGVLTRPDSKTVVPIDACADWMVGVPESLAEATD